MMQLTTIRGRYTPREASRLGTKAFTSICTTDTKPAMTEIYAGIRKTAEGGEA